MIYELLSFAEQTGERMANEYIMHGDYRPSESWGSEGQIYPSLTGIALLNLYKVTSKSIFLEGVRAIIDSNHKKRLPSGGWPLRLAAEGDGIKFNVSKELMDLTVKVEDLPSTVAAMRLIGEYIILTDDTSYLEELKRSCQFLTQFWNEEEGCFDEMMNNKVMKLRANPKSYQIYAYQCVITLSSLFPELVRYKLPLYQTIKETFEGFDEYTYPLLHAMHAALIIKTEPDSKYTKTLVNNRIQEQIALESKFIIADEPGALGHYDGLRGFCLEEGHLRNSVGAALVMDIYDTYVEGGNYTQTQMYADLTNWIQGMYADSKYYEYVDLTNGEKRGVGSGGQYLPIFWILGEF